MTKPKEGKILGKIVPRHENKTLKMLGWSRTIMLFESLILSVDVHVRWALCQDQIA
ncbi:hypothetical protein L292_2254 [Acinetobacter junii CIP 107470 = MTCC 11364]|uniref:Uncharacterized protein n=1 Tax=Acinetobacter junii CIP 107470 = MTCC 11364 TaxID=1217666 RepID=S7WUA1_ACIJU|nr:hypothetical protein L292_2254 [Acinetobacter junii CIP 107470 = MTCC 11364]